MPLSYKRPSKLLHKFALLSFERLSEKVSLLWVFQGSPEDAVERGDCILLHARQDMRIGVERDADVRMAQSLTYDLWVNSLAKKLRSVCMPEVMEAEMLQL